jgi:dsDNA-specific endonuclease/ATPase MutS2
MEEDIFLKNYPRLDLHGYDRDYARMLTNDFILENVLLKNKTIVIIHGHGLGIVKHAVYDALKYNKNVLSFKSDMFNDGLTVVTLKID